MFSFIEKLRLIKKLNENKGQNNITICYSKMLNT